MRIIKAIVRHPRRSDPPGRIEAEVVITVQPGPGEPSETRTIPVSAPVVDPKGRDLRTRLVADAMCRACRPMAAAA